MGGVEGSAGYISYVNIINFFHLLVKLIILFTLTVPLPFLMLSHDIFPGRLS